MEFNDKNNLENNNGELDTDKKEYIEGNSFIMEKSDHPEDSYNGESYTMGDNNPEVVSVNSNSTYNTEDNRQNSNTKKRFRRKQGRGFFSYIIVGLICALIGGVASGAATIYLLPRTNLFQETALYNSIEDVMYRNGFIYGFHPTSAATEEGALTVTEIVRKVGPAVVGVTTSVGNRPTGIGTGMIINEEGYVLTNYHVIEGARTVQVILSNGKEVAARIINYDEDHDVAVIKITDDVRVPAVVELGDSTSLQVGETAVAIGNPLGREFLNTVTVGVISAVNRNISSGNNELSFIQTDAAINRGNSGGPLINSRGQVIGINTAKIGSSGVEGLGFAIPIDAIKDKIEHLSVPILMIGIEGRAVTEEAARANNIPMGVFVVNVVEYSPAEFAGIRPGDIITKFGGEKVQTVQDLNRLKNKYRAGDAVPIEIERNGTKQNLEIRFPEN
jgi:serine protease Do